MGCDIHCFIEVKVDGTWGGIEVDMDRDYLSFALMAGVRNQNFHIPVSEPKGLPEDISETTKLEADFWKRDAHSHSWLSLEGVNLVVVRLAEEESSNSDLECIKEKMSYLRQEYEGATDVRLVFWFDN